MALSIADLLARTKQQTADDSKPTEAGQTGVIPAEAPKPSGAIGNLSKPAGLPNMDSFMDSVREMAGVKTGSGAVQHPLDTLGDPKAVAHNEVRARIAALHKANEMNSPLQVRTLLREMRKIIKDNDGLQFELSRDEIRDITVNIIKCSAIELATKAANKKGVRAQVSGGDLDNLLL